MQSKTILSMQSGIGGTNNNAGSQLAPVLEQSFQIQKQQDNGTQLITPHKPVEKMISRDVKGNLGIVPISSMNIPKNMEQQQLSQDNEKSPRQIYYN